MTCCSHAGRSSVVPDFEEDYIEIKPDPPPQDEPNKGTGSHGQNGAGAQSGGTGHAQTGAGPQPGSGPQSGPRPEAQPGQPPPPQLSVRNIGDILRAGLPPPRDKLLGNTFCKEFLSGLISPGGIGKTSVRLLQAVAVSCGRTDANGIGISGERVYKRS